LVVSVNERLVDLFMERAIDVVRLEHGTRRKVLALLRELEDDLAALIAKHDPNAPARKRYQRERLVKLLKAVRATIQASYRNVNVLMAAEIRDVIDLEATWTGRAIEQVTQLDFVDGGVTRTMLQTLVSDVLIQGAPTKEWWGRQAAGLADRFADEMRRGVTLGENNARLIERVRGTDTVPGLMQVSRSSAERLVRSSVQTAANVAREATYEQNAELITCLQWHSTLDMRTSEHCMVRDGLKYHLKTHKPMGHTVPWLEGPGKLHWQCRSTSVPVLKSWRELGVDIDDIPETTRASMDGQVPADTNFEAWLKKQSQERQDTVLGEEKADLWRRGKITFRDLLDQSGRPLTTEQLRAKAARR
jgi:SPP1 gp7 family putative phage head morphogenesis protein